MALAFVTGATGLLGNNLVRLLVERGYQVRALARSRAKAEQQLGGLAGVTIVAGDMGDVAGFAAQLAGCDLLFHTAAHFRDSYKGGNHWEALRRVNVEGTERLLQAAYAAGIRRMVHVSSVAVLQGPPGAPIDETMDRREADADDYYRSKILSERAVRGFLDTHPDMHVSFVLPGWMHGPGDVGPTSAGQLVLDVVRRRLPGIPPGSFSLVDARDVAATAIAAAERGRRGERYLAAGRHMTMAEVIPLVGRIAGVAVPRWRVPGPLLMTLALFAEGYARLTGRPVLMSLASVRLILREGDRGRYDHAKSIRELGVTFRPAEQTIADEIGWYRRNGWLPPAPAQAGEAAPAAA